MRHKKHKWYFGRNVSHREALFVNLVKNLILREKIITTKEKACVLTTWFDKAVTMAKDNDVNAKRRVAAFLRIRKTPDGRTRPLSDKTHHRSGDRDVMRVLFDVLLPRLQEKTSGFTSKVNGGFRKGDGASLCRVNVFGANQDKISEQV